MKIVVESIPAGGRQVAFNLGSPWAVDAASISLDRPPKRLSGAFDLKRAKQVVVVDLHADTAATATCDRCGEECELALKVDTRLLYAPEEKGGADYDGLSLDGRPLAVPETKKGGDEDEDEDEKPEGKQGSKHRDKDGIELEERDLDVGWYREGEVVLSDVLCEALALATPPRIVCADTAECDRRTDALLAATQVAASGPFAALGALKRPASEG